MVKHTGEEMTMEKKDLRCRSCGSLNLETVLDLGRMPLADALLTEDELNSPEAAYPLEAAFCTDCSLLQITETVPPEMLFCKKYPYYSSFSDELLRHSRENALELIESRGLDEKSLAVEIASNDGYLLKNFVEKDIPCLGIDPAEGPAESAEKIGVPTICAFFNAELASQLTGIGKRADVIIANNVLAHVADVRGFLAGVRTLLKEDADAAVKSLLEEERESGLGDISYYNEFAAKVNNVKSGLTYILSMLREQGASIAAYGAAAKGATLINYVGLGKETIDFVVDRNIHKQGRFMPGVRIPISGPERLLHEQPDYVLILAWNFAEEIMAQQEEYRARGGKFILPIPEWKIA